MGTTLAVDQNHAFVFLFLISCFLHLLTPLRSLTLLIREVLAGSVFLPSMDYLADPVSVDAPRAQFHFSGQQHAATKKVFSSCFRTQ